MSTAPVYQIMLSSKYDSGRRETLEAYVIDRVPQGPISNFIELQDGSTACDPCQVSLYNQNRNKPMRYLLRLPESVKQKYVSHFRTEYVNTYTLPGYISWLIENGYEINTKLEKVMPREWEGMWIEYLESSGLEFPAGRSLMETGGKKK
jgi:hypothetical protein